MLYLDYSRKPGEWVPNEYGGSEDLEAIAFLRELNEVAARARRPGVIIGGRGVDRVAGRLAPDVRSAASASASSGTWAGCTTRSTTSSSDPIYRRYHHDELTFSAACTRSARTSSCRSRTTRSCTARARCSTRCPATAGSSFANLRALYGYMWAHPGKKLLFMGGELGAGAGVEPRALARLAPARARRARGASSALVRDLNRVYRATPALWELDFDPAGFRWLEANDAATNVLAFARVSATATRAPLVCVCNFSPVPRHGLPRRAAARRRWREVLNTDSALLRRQRRRQRSAASRPRRCRGTSSRARPS